MKSRVCAWVEEATAGICKDYEQNPAITASAKKSSNKKRPIHDTFCWGNGALTFRSCV